MRPGFVTRLVNGPLFDPVLYVRHLNRRRALLFDCGRFSGLSNREILALDAVFVTHTHMDHFMGFDCILRTVLHRGTPLHVYGPEGMGMRMAARLAAYTWNLTSGYGLEVFVHEVLRDGVLLWCARAGEGFRLRRCGAEPREGTCIVETPRYRVDAVILDHNVPCLGYVVSEPVHVHVRPEALKKHGFRTGPWIGDLKDKVAQGLLDRTLLVPTCRGEEEWKVGDLSDWLFFTSPGHRIGYFTDFRASRENVERIRSAACGLDTLYIEAYYLSEREEEAYLKAHVSARQAGVVARLTGASRVVPMHVSPRYHDRFGDIVSELERARLGGE